MKDKIIKLLKDKIDGMYVYNGGKDGDKILFLVDTENWDKDDYIETLADEIIKTIS